MSNINYTEIVVFTFDIIIESDNHKDCNNVAKKIKDFLVAWTYSCTYPKEHKSARKGDVLKRDIQAKFTDYPSIVIAFREALRCICNHHNLKSSIFNTSVRLIDRGTLPKDSHLNLLS